MGRFDRWVFLALLCALFVWASGCAHSYNTIETESLTYTGQEPSDSVTFSYRTDALLAAENDDYSEKAREKNVMPVAVRVNNRRSESIELSRRTVRVRSGDVERSLLDPGVTADMLGQAYGWHVLWALLNGWFTRTKNGKVVQKTWIPIGPAIGLFNIIRGATANSNMEEDFKKRHLLGKTVVPDSTVTGLLFVSKARGQPLTFEYEAPERDAASDSTRSSPR